MADDAGFTYENDAIIGAGEPVGGYDVTVDLSSTNGVNDALLRMQAGLDEGVVNIAGSERLLDQRARERESRDGLRSFLASYDTVSNANAQWRRMAVEARAQHEQNKRKIEQGQIALQTALDNGEITEEQFRILKERGDQLEANSAALATRVTELENSVGLREEALFDASQSSQTAVTLLGQLGQLDNRLVTIEFSPRSHIEMPQRMAVYQDAETGQYYVINPFDSTDVTVLTEEEHAEQLAYIRLQVDAGEMLANDPRATGEAAQELADQVDRLKAAHIYLFDEIGRLENSSEVIERYKSLIRDWSDYTEEKLQIAAIRDEMERIEEEIIQWRADLEDMTAANRISPEEADRVLAELEARYAEQQLNFENRVRILELNFEARYSEFESFFAQVEDYQRQAIEASQRGIQDRDDQIRSAFEGEWTPPTEWGITSLVPDSWLNWTINGFTAEVAASNELERAWREDVLQVEIDGVMHDVYRDNERVADPNNTQPTLYTYDPETGTRTYITDPQTEIALYAQSYNHETKEVRFFKNETPHSEDPNNTFQESFIANTKTYDFQRAVKNIGDRGEAAYGADPRPASADGEGGSDNARGLTLSFGQSADSFSGIMDYSVNAVRSGFDTAFAMGRDFSSTAGLQFPTFGSTEAETTVTADANDAAPGEDNTADPTTKFS